MKRSKFTEEQIIGILREQDAGAKTADKVSKWSALRLAKRASIPSISAFLPMKAASAAFLFRRAFSARRSWRGVVSGLRRVFVVTPWSSCIAVLGSTCALSATLINLIRI